jgi:hypothetical protein
LAKSADFFNRHPWKGFMTPVILWLLCGVVAAVTASQKGRSGLGWFIIGALLGPFGLLIFFLPESSGKAAADRICPQCAAGNRPEALFCQQCGQPLPRPR